MRRGGAGRTHEDDLITPYLINGNVYAIDQNNGIEIQFVHAIAREIAANQGWLLSWDISSCIVLYALHIHIVFRTVVVIVMTSTRQSRKQEKDDIIIAACEIQRH